MGQEWNSYDPALCDSTDEYRKEAQKRYDGVDLFKIGTTCGVLSEKDQPQHSQMTDKEVTAITQKGHRVDILIAAHVQGAEGIKTYSGTASIPSNTASTLTTNVFSYSTKPTACSCRRWQSSSESVTTVKNTVSPSLASKKPEPLTAPTSSPSAGPTKRA